MQRLCNGTGTGVACIDNNRILVILAREVSLEFSRGGPEKRCDVAS